jgi:hypothetical protein
MGPKMGPIVWSIAILDKYSKTQDFEQIGCSSDFQISPNLIKWPYQPFFEPILDKIQQNLYIW